MRQGSAISHTHTGEIAGGVFKIGEPPASFVLRVALGRSQNLKVLGASTVYLHISRFPNNFLAAG